MAHFHSWGVQPGGIHACAWISPLLLAVLMVGCSSGDIELVSHGSSEDEGEPRAASGGSDADSEQDTGGSSTGGSSASGGSNPGPPTSGLPYPCLVTDLCDLFCEEPRRHCIACEVDEECPSPVSLCDKGREECVECRSDEDCGERYGGAFPECDHGRCVQCDRDDDYSGGIRCDRGWCGGCLRSDECAEGYLCFEGHCLPDWGLTEAPM